MDCFLNTYMTVTTVHFYHKNWQQKPCNGTWKSLLELRLWNADERRTGLSQECPAVTTVLSLLQAVPGSYCAAAIPNFELGWIQNPYSPNTSPQINLQLKSNMKWLSTISNNATLQKIFHFLSYANLRELSFPKINDICRPSSSTNAQVDALEKIDFDAKWETHGVYLYT